MEAEDVAEYLDVVGMREYVDDSGTVWRRRGTLLEGKTLERRTRRPEIVVLHHYLGTVTEIQPRERSAFWEAVRTKLTESRHAGFVGAEFTDGSRRHLVLIDESC